MQVTQKMIAREVGVSQRAVAYALSDDPVCHAKLRAETRQRILDVANRLGYRPDRHAQMLRRGKSGVIGMIQRGEMLQVATLRAFYAAQAVYRSGYNLLTNDVLWNEDGMRKACDAMLDAHVEGVMVMNTDMFPADLARLRDAGIPLVQVSGQGMERVPHVRADVHQGMRDLTQHLLGVGYRRLTLVTAWSEPQRGPDPRQWPTAERVAGFQEALDGAGEVIFEESPFDWLTPYRQGLVAMRKLLQRAERPEVVLCTNDDWAVGALRACAAAGVQVPEEIAITGFDNSSLGEFSMVPLTTMAQQPQVMAQTAVTMLVEMIKGERPATGDHLVKVPCQLVARESCGAKLRETADRT